MACSRALPARPSRRPPPRGLLVGLLLVGLLLVGCGEEEPATSPGPQVRPWDDALPPAPVPSPDDPKPAVPGRTLDVPQGEAVELDGLVDVEAWSDALQRPLGRDGSVLRLKQAGGMLLVGLDAHHPWPRGGRLTLLLAPEGAEAQGLFVEGAARVEYEPFEHNRPHLLAWRHGVMGLEPVAADAVGRSVSHGPRASAELALPLALLGFDPEAPAPRRFALLFSQGPGRPALTWPPGLDLQSGRGVPPDLASSVRWGALEVEPAEAAPPAPYDEAAWAAMRELDEELARRGIAAHALVLEIEEEPAMPKRDAEMVPTLVGNLRFIAEHEPLSPSDLKALARGYRFLNRHEESLATLDALASHPGWRGSERVAYDRALLLEAMERFDEAAAIWDGLATSGASNAGAYAGMARRARARQADWEAEQAARAEDDRRDDLPLLLLRTNRGDILVRLHADDVPEAVRHVLDLARRRDEDGSGFYDGTLFHRVIGGFVAQGGDPTSKDGDCDAAGTGGGPTSVTAEVSRRHGFWRGTLGFARGIANVNESQFFILTGPKPGLRDQGFTAFGHVVAGMEVADRLEVCDVLEEVVVLRGLPDEETSGSEADGAR